VNYLEIEQSISEKVRILASGKDDLCDTNLITEWQTARTVLLDTDGRLHDLRKFGFSVLTGLLAVSSFILPSSQLAVVSGTVTAYPETIKFAILAVLLILIFALSILDHNFQVLQLAAATRAMVIEKNLGFELTEIITNRYGRNKVKGLTAFVYVLYCVAVWVLGYFVLQSHTLTFWILSVFTFLTIALSAFITTWYRMKLPCGKIDWTIDRTQCTSGDEVRITLTNLGTKEKDGITFKAGDVLWQVAREDNENDIIHSEKLEKPLSIKEGDSYTWLWKTVRTKHKRTVPLKEGIYRIKRAVHPEWGMHPPKLEQLTRKLSVKSKLEKKPFRVVLIEESNQEKE
jgi:hypothetical protein